MNEYEVVQLKILNTTKFDENSDLAKTYLGKENITRLDQLTAGEKFPLTEKGSTIGKLLGGTDCQTHLKTGASKSFMSKRHYLKCKTSHSLTKCNIMMS